jgi:signal transduction histidine kinase/CheY-like chemotaxis protein
MPQAVKAAVANAAAGNSQTDRMTLNLPTGTRIFDFSFRPVKDAAGKVTAIVPEAADITARVLAEQTLQQALKMEALGNLTGGIAHDFNNLLMAVIGSLDLLRKKLPNDPKLMRLLDNAAEGAKRGAALTQRMLSFARQQPLKPTSVDLPGLVRGMTDLLRRSIGPAISIDTHFPLALACAAVDANQLELALLNLAVNARDAMPKGGMMMIAAREADAAEVPGLASGRYVCLSVTDSGCGMDAQTLGRAQEPFFTTKGAGKGTGLGLSMVHGLAEQSGGRLILKSGLNEGTTAEIWLPVSASSLHAPEASVPTLLPFSHSSLCVIVVDDDLLVLENTVAMLEDLGHRVIAARSADEAKRLVRETKALDLVITDHAMPGVTGLQLAEWLKSERPQVRVLLATGFAESQSALPQLNKPFDQSTLVRAIGDAMRAASVIQLHPKSA